MSEKVKKGEREGEEVVARIQKSGRLTLPKRFLEQKGLSEGDLVLLTIKRAKIVVAEEPGDDK